MNSCAQKSGLVGQKVLRQSNAHIRDYRGGAGEIGQGRGQGAVLACDAVNSHKVIPPVAPIPVQSLCAKVTAPYLEYEDATSSYARKCFTTVTRGAGQDRLDYSRCLVT